MHPEIQIKIIADTLLPGFIPKDKNETNLTFHFTIPPKSSYKVHYQRSNKDEWVFVSFEAVES